LIFAWGKRAADMPKNCCRSLRQRLKMLFQIRQQELKSAPLMIMRHTPS